MHQISVIYLLLFSELGLWCREPSSRTTRLTDSREKEWEQLPEGEKKVDLNI